MDPQGVKPVAPKAAASTSFATPAMLMVHLGRQKRKSPLKLVLFCRFVGAARSASRSSHVIFSSFDVAKLMVCLGPLSTIKLVNLIYLT